MAETEQKTAVEDDWEEVHASQPDDTISVISESETLGKNHDYVEVDNPKKTIYPGRNYQNPNEQPVGPLPTLRRSLYALKDTLRESIEQLEDFNQEYASMQALFIGGPIMRIQQKQVDALNMLLTNSDADWETLAQDGGMTFDEFAEMDPVSIDELCKIMKKFVDDVRAHKYRRLPDHDEDEDVAFLDFILPAVDEVSALLRVDNAGEDMSDSKHESLAEESLMRQAAEMSFREENEFNKKDEGDSNVNEGERSVSDNNDEKVHEKMMALSDW